MGRTSRLIAGLGNVALALLSSVVFCLAVELLFRLFAVRFPEVPSDWKVRRDLRSHSICPHAAAVAASSSANPALSFANPPLRFQQSLKLHPFFGYLYDPSLPGMNNLGFQTKYNIEVSDQGYCISPCGESGRLVVGIFGGSFAQLVGKDTTEYLESALKERFPGRKIAVVNFAIAGHALPQQMFVFLTYHGLLDAAVFLDGLNEVWNPVINNDAGVPPEYANVAHWRFKMATNDLEPGRIWKLAILSLQEQFLGSFTGLTLAPVLDRSFALHFIWYRLFNRHSADIRMTSYRLQQYYIRGHKFYDLTDAKLQKFAARRWSAYHRDMHFIAEKQSLCELHMLQPTPYYIWPGKKSPAYRSAAEKQILEKDSARIAPYVITGYPLLLKEQHFLQSKFPQLPIEDLTQLYDSTAKDLWIDGAHANQTGNTLVADRIVERLQPCLAQRAALLPQSAAPAAGTR